MDFVSYSCIKAKAEKTCSFSSQAISFFSVKQIHVFSSAKQLLQDIFFISLHDYGLGRIQRVTFAFGHCTSGAGLTRRRRGHYGCWRRSNCTIPMWYSGHHTYVVQWPSCPMCYCGHHVIQWPRGTVTTMPTWYSGSSCGIRPLLRCRIT